MALHVMHKKQYTNVTCLHKFSFGAAGTGELVYKGKKVK